MARCSRTIAAISGALLLVASLPSLAAAAGPTLVSAVANPDSVTAIVNSVNAVVPVLANDNRGLNGPVPAQAVLYESSGTTSEGGSYTCANTSCRYTAPADFLGTDTFTYRLAYPNPQRPPAPPGLTTGPVTPNTLVTVTLAPNDPPVAADDTATTHGTLFTTFEVIANDTDPNRTLIGERLSTVAASSPSIEGGTGSCSGFTTCSYRAPAGFTGTDSFTYSVVDVNGATDEGTVVVTVLENQPPTAADDEFTVDHAYGTGAPIVIYAMANDVDPESDPLYPVAVSNATAAGGTVTCIGANSGNNSGACLYTPTEGFLGTDTFQYRADDQAGGLSAPATVSVTVNLDDPPVAVDDVASTRGTFPVSTFPVENDTDPETGAQVVSVDTVSAHGGSVDCTTGLSGNPCVYTAAPGFVGVDTFRYTITDSTGGINTDTGTVTVTVTANIAPIANDDVFWSDNWQDDPPYRVSVLTNDTDAEADALELVYTAQTTANGSFVECAGTSCEVDPVYPYPALDSFDYTVSDGHGGTATATVTVHIGDNAPPVGAPDSAATRRGIPVTVDVLANDYDARDRFALRAQPGTSTSSEGGVVVCTATDCTYTPPSAFSGIDTFTYTVLDTEGSSDVGTVTVSVSDQEGAAGSVAPSGIVTSDPEGDGATLQDPIETAVQLGESGGDVTIAEGPTQIAPPTGFRLLDFESVITAPPATVAAPLVLRFTLDASLLATGGLQANQVAVLRDGAYVAECTTPSVATAIPDACVFERVPLPDGDVRIGVYSSHASRWNFGNAVTVIVPGTAAVAEGNAGTKVLNIPVTLSAASNVAVTAQWATANNTATAPSDYVAATGTVTFAPGQTAATVPVTIKGDTTVEPDETVLVGFSNPTNATIGGYYGFGAGTIQDDDRPVIVPGTATVAEGNAGTKVLKIPVTLSAASNVSVTAKWSTANNTATAPSDYVAATGTVTFAPGQTAKTVPVTIKGDTTTEPDETVLVSFTNPTNATIGGYYGFGAGTIQDDDRPTVTVGNVSTIEGNSGTKALTFTVSLSKAASSAVSIAYATGNGTATAPSDYQAKAGTLTIAAGVKTATVVVTVVGDTTREPNETFTLTLSNASANVRITDASGVGTITNND